MNQHVQKQVQHSEQPRASYSKCLMSNVNNNDGTVKGTSGVEWRVAGSKNGRRHTTNVIKGTCVNN